jgi:hypothetical protein
MSSEVTELINALRSGEMSLEEVAGRFRERRWPRKRKEEPSTYLEMAAAAEHDPAPYVEGSFDDVVAAYDRNELSDDEYEVLSKAVADSKRAEDQATRE